MDRERLIEIQKGLAKRVVLEDDFKKGRVAGVDLAYSGGKATCGVVVLDYDTLEIVEKKLTEVEVDFPYVPTFLAFREALPIMKSLEGVKFDILMLDGQGIAHPRGIGIASHIGVLMDVPTIGVAKKILCGDVLGETIVGKPAPIIFGGRQVGYALKTKEKTRPIFISPGHRFSLESSLEVTQHFIKSHKLPEPTRLAHLLANSRSI